MPALAPRPVFRLGAGDIIYLELVKSRRAAGEVMWVRHTVTGIRFTCALVAISSATFTLPANRMSAS